MKTKTPDYTAELREYETAHAVWMKTSIFDPVQIQQDARRKLDAAREKYVAAYKAANPDHIVM